MITIFALVVLSVAVTLPPTNPVAEADLQSDQPMDVDPTPAPFHEDVDPDILMQELDDDDHMNVVDDEEPVLDDPMAVDDEAYAGGEATTNDEMDVCEDSMDVD